MNMFQTDSSVPPAGEAVGNFNPDDIDGVVDDVTQLALLFVYSGIVVATATMVHVFLVRRAERSWRATPPPPPGLPHMRRASPQFSSTGAKQANRIRAEYLRAVLRHEIGWHDAHAGASLDVKLATGIPRIEEAIGLKVGDLINQVTQGLVGVSISFYYSWKLTLVIAFPLPPFSLATPPSLMPAAAAAAPTQVFIAFSPVMLTGMGRHWNPQWGPARPELRPVLLLGMQPSLPSSCRTWKAHGWPSTRRLAWLQTR
jgi:hypothetical protein